MNDVEKLGEHLNTLLEPNERLFKPTEGMRPIKPKIMIATPNLGSMCIKNVQNLLAWFQSTEINFCWYAPGGIVPHDRARNAAWKNFLESGYDALFFVDAFTALPDNGKGLYRMLDAMDKGVCESCGRIWTDGTCCDDPKRGDVDMIAAVPQVFQITKEKVPSLVPVAYRWDKERDGGGYFHAWASTPGKIETVDVSTLACTLIRRNVLEAVSRPAFKFTMGDQWGVAGLGEDFMFCENVRKAGHRVWADFSIVAHHYKQMDTRIVNDVLVGELKAKMATVGNGPLGGGDESVPGSCR